MFLQCSKFYFVLTERPNENERKWEEKHTTNYKNRQKSKSKSTSSHFTSVKSNRSNCEIMERWNIPKKQSEPRELHVRLCISLILSFHLWKQYTRKITKLRAFRLILSISTLFFSISMHMLSERILRHGQNSILFVVVVIHVFVSVSVCVAITALAAAAVVAAHFFFFFFGFSFSSSFFYELCARNTYIHTYIVVRMHVSERSRERKTLIW